MAFFGQDNSQYLLLYTDEMQFKKTVLIKEHLIMFIGLNYLIC